MNILQAVILAIIQGLTEFLPVSSSGHLVLGEALLGSQAIGDSIAFELVVHLGTFLAVLVLFWTDIVQLFKTFSRHILKPQDLARAYAQEPEFQLTIHMVVGMLPAGIIGLLLKDDISALFSDPHMVSLTLLITAGMLFSTRFFTSRTNPITFWRALLIGFAQALALVPGISRSGSTISTALALGIKQEEAARFSFIMVLPLILAATLLEFKDLLEVGISGSEVGVLFVGFIVSFFIGYLSLRWLLRILQKGKFHYFAWYCLVIAVAGFFYF